MPGGWTKLPGVELRSRRVGIGGLGGIGREMPRICKAVGMDAVFWNRSGVADPALHLVPLDELLATSNVVTLRLALNQQNTGSLDAGRNATMKPGAILINTSRGAIFDEAARSRRCKPPRSATRHSTCCDRTAAGGSSATPGTQRHPDRTLRVLDRACHDQSAGRVQGIVQVLHGVQRDTA